MDSILFNNIFRLLVLNEVRLLLVVVYVCDPLSFSLELPRVSGLPAGQITLVLGSIPRDKGFPFSTKSLDWRPRTISFDVSRCASTIGCYFASTVIISVEYCTKYFFLLPEEGS